MFNRYSFYNNDRTKLHRQIFSIDLQERFKIREIKQAIDSENKKFFEPKSGSKSIDYEIARTLIDEQYTILEYAI